MNTFGYFKWTDPVLNGLRYGNWGSRPYEYLWASNVVDAKDKTILDIGTGLPSEHNWYAHVVENLGSKFYCGIDMDSRLKNEEINTENCKMLWMNLENLQFESDMFDLIYSISTFEHFDNIDVFMAGLKETHRVCKKDAVMIVTLDELWDINKRFNQHSSWNELERELIRKNMFNQNELTFGMKDFIKLISDYFEPINLEEKDIKKINADESIIHSKEWNSSVSYGVFKVKK